MDCSYKIAVLSFGNLPNQLQNTVNEETLSVKKPHIQSGVMPNANLNVNSPFIPAADLKLPVRLGRVSSANTNGRRITMTLCDGASNETVFVAQSKMKNLNDAIRNLRVREGISQEGYKNIGFVNLAENTSRARMPEVADKIKEWALINSFDAVVWTDLAPNIEFAPNNYGREVEAMLAKDPTLLINTQKYIKNLAGPLNNLQQRILVAEPVDAYKDSLSADFDERAKPENQTHKSKSQWYTSDETWDWGPNAAKYAAPKVPDGVNAVEWKRDRLIEAALYWVNKGVPYSSATASQFGLKLPEDVTPRFGLRGHFPARNCGLDCSNFASWVYNFALGKQFSSDVGDQINNGFRSVGRKVTEDEPLKKGDLIYYDGRVQHVAIYMDENHVIESTSAGEGRARVVDIRKQEYAYLRPNENNRKFLFARRAIE